MFRLEIIESGYIMADGGAMFGAIPKRAWQRKYPSDEHNLCPLAMRCVLAISDTHKILIDTGMGNKHNKEIAYYQPYGLKDIVETINSLGYKADQITDVVLTHLHFDHCGGATHYDENKEVIPTFPKAHYWLSEKQWNNFLTPNKLEADSIFANNIEPIKQADLLRLIGQETKICEGFRLQLFDGHSEGQIVPYITTNEGIYVFPGDLTPTASHVSLEWISAYDICALKSIDEKSRFLEDVEKESYTLIYCHDVNTVKSKIKKMNDNYKAV